MNNKVYVYKTQPDYQIIDKEKIYIRKYVLSELDDIICQGNTVVLKPNFVKESHMKKKNEWEYVITHSEIIRLVLNYVVNLLNNEGKIYIVDAPQTDSDYEKIIKNIGLKEIVEEVQKNTNVVIEYFDLREERWFYKEGIIVKKKKLVGDPNGYVSINLAEQSEFYGKENKKFYGADYDMTETARYHNDIDNIYVVSKTILSADVFINLPKMKTHKLAGITCCLKNLVGTCVIKNSIPHHTLGSPEDGGDKFKKYSNKNETENTLKNIALNVLKLKNPLINYPFIIIKKFAGLFLGSADKEIIRNGMWYGNDTIWRSCLDLNKILLYADKEGVMRDKIQRKYFAVVDGIIAGEKNGPMEPDAKSAGVLISGTNPVAVDTVAATIMGFDYKKVPSIRNAYEIKNYPLVSYDAEDIAIDSNVSSWCDKVSDILYEDSLKFEPHYGWKGYIEKRY